MVVTLASLQEARASPWQRRRARRRHDRGVRDRPGASGRCSFAAQLGGDRDRGAEPRRLPCCWWRARITVHAADSGATAGGGDISARRTVAARNVPPASAGQQAELAKLVLFRDQLDRYGELDSIAKKMEAGTFTTFSRNTTHFLMLMIRKLHIWE